jgi:hypothetical protein
MGDIPEMDTVVVSTTSHILLVVSQSNAFNWKFLAVIANYAFKFVGQYRYNPVESYD